MCVCRTTQRMAGLEAELDGGSSKPVTWSSCSLGDWCASRFRQRTRGTRVAIIYAKQRPRGRCYEALSTCRLLYRRCVCVIIEATVCCRFCLIRHGQYGTDCRLAFFGKGRSSSTSPLTAQSFLEIAVALFRSTSEDLRHCVGALSTPFQASNV